MKFNFLFDCHYYTLQKCLIETILQMKTTKNTIKMVIHFILDHPYRILINGGSGSGKTNALLNLISQQGDIDKNLFI